MLGGAAPQAINLPQPLVCFMKTLTVSAQKDFLERLASVSPVKALSELIWNGLDAGSERVQVMLELNELSGLEKIRVRDEGIGINYEHLEVLFGHLGNSWKKTNRLFRGRFLHGANGEGRFKAFALGNRVEWETRYSDNTGRIHQYQILARADSIEKPSLTQPEPADGRSPGTEVAISEIEKSHGALLAENVLTELARHFAAYLTKYPNVQIDFNGRLVDPVSIQERTAELKLDEVDLGNGKKIPLEITLIEWAAPTKRLLHLCDSQGATFHEVDAGSQIKAPGFQFTAYLKTDLFKELNQQGLLVIEELHPEVDAILKAARQAVNQYFSQRLAELHVPAVQRWKTQSVYPFEENPKLTKAEQAEREVFDTIAADVETHLPALEDLEPKSKQFLFQLLAETLRQNPQGVKQIMTDVLKLKPKEQVSLAKVLQQG